MNISNLFVINPSINVSPYCYSLLKAETYTTCAHACVYCFGRWYRVVSAGGNENAYIMLRNFERTLKFLSKKRLKTIPFRLSTLVDPFQPIEKEKGFSRRVLVLCRKYEVPLIINTKAPYFLTTDYLSILKALGDGGLVVVQISLSTLSDETAKKLEPYAPPPIKRLDAAEKLSGDNIPVVVRLQPFIPGITDWEIKEIIEQTRYAGVKQIIVESLRDEIENLRFYEELAYDKSTYKDLNLWTSYSPSVEVPSKIVRPNSTWRLVSYKLVKELCDKYGLEFSTCKEGFYEYHTAKNCCGMHLMEGSKYALRPTLQEAWEYYRRHKKFPKFKELIDELGEKYIFGEGLKRYPRPIRKGIKSHEKILREILDEQRDRISTLIPTIFQL